MEWVETTAKTIDEAKSDALDQLGVAADEAEFDVVDEPKPGLFGRTRGEARVRARVKPAQVRPKNERRRKSSKSSAASETPASESAPDDASTEAPEADDTSADTAPETRETPKRSESRRGSGRSSGGRNDRDRNRQQERTMNDDRDSDVPPQDVGDAAVAFMDGLVDAFGADGSSELTIDGTELDVAVTGEGLGLLVGPGGRTLNAIQDLARVAAQRRLGDHETRLRIDVAGYRVRRSAALGSFARDVAAQVRESGEPRSLEPMSSADRKVVHDALNDEDGVSSRSEGDDPNRRVVVVPD